MKLEQMGWNVIVVWECQLKKPIINETIEQLVNQLTGLGPVNEKGRK